jgi:enolase-phosphatase E1
MAMNILDRIDVVVLDIEGTTTPIDFVHKTLFQYAKQNLCNFLKKNKNSDIVKKALDDLRTTYIDIAEKGAGNHNEGTAEEVSIKNDVSILNRLIDADSKASQLKLIEGMIWEEGYKDGSLRGEVYSDVPVCMKKWTAGGKRICIYSSGSVLAQKLIFSSTEFGNLTLYITNYFDTEIGRKTDPESYRKIAATLGKNPERILFLSDSLMELNAAASAGLRTIMIDREGKLNMNDYPVIVSNFSEIA